jgi:hypothetical protein
MKPTSCPLASPSSIHCADELQLDLSFLAADEDGPNIVSNGSEIYYRENEAIDRELNNKYKDITSSNHSRSDNNRETKVNCSDRSPLCEEIDTGDVGNIPNPREEQWLGSGSDSEGKHNRNGNLLKNTDSNGKESSGTVQNFGDISSSNQGSDEERTDSTASYTSSYATLSERSLYSCSSSCSSKSRDMRESDIPRSNSSHSSVRSNSDLANGFGHSNKTEEYTDFVLPVGDTKKRPSPNDFQQVLRKLHNGNLNHRRESNGRDKTSAEKSSAVTRNLRADTESQVSVSSGGEDSICVSSLGAVDRGTESQVTVHSGGEGNANISASESKDKINEEPDNFIASSGLENGYEGISMSAQSSLDRCREVDEVEFDDIILYAGCSNRYIANDEASGGHVNDNSNRISSEICGNYCLNKSHNSATEERRIKSMGICNYHTNGFILNESNNRPIHDSDFRTTGDNCSRNENYFEEHLDKIMSRVELSANTVSEENLDSPEICDNYILPTDFKQYEDFDKASGKSAFKYHQLPSANNREVQRNVDSLPTGHHATERTRRSSAISGRDAGTETKPSVKRPESHYFSDDFAPDMPLSASETVEAVLYARRLLCVLERALDRTLSSNADRSNTESSLIEISTSFSARNTGTKQRPRSLSPNILRRCTGIDSVRSQTETEICSDRVDGVLGADTGTSNTKWTNAQQTSDVKPTLSCDGVSMRGCCYRHATPFLSVSPEQLRKQRALLKPAADRMIEGDVIQMLDVADILRNAVLRRRTFMDPTDEFVYEADRSVSEWSLENA